MPRCFLPLSRRAAVLQVPAVIRREIRETLVLAGPVVVTQLAQISMGFVDTIMVGRLGPEVLAGAALGSTMFYTFGILCLGVVLAVSPLVSQAFGAGDDAAIRHSVQQGLWVALVLTVGCMGLFWNIAPLLRLLGQDEATLLRAQAYLRAILWGVFPYLGLVALRGFLEGVSRPRAVTVITLCGVLVNIGGNYVLMYGKLGFPALGLVGTGYASACAFWFNFLVLLGYLLARPAFRQYHLFRDVLKPDGVRFREVFRLGLPIGAALGIESGLFSITVMMMGWIGTVALAAHQVAIQAAALTFMVPLGIGMATTVRVGQAIGRRERVAAERAGFTGIGLSVVFMTLTALLFWTAPRLVIGLYLDLEAPANAEVVRLTVTLLGTAAVFQVFDGMQVSAAGALRGLKDTRATMIISLFTYWGMGLTSGYLLGFTAGFGAIGLWWGLVVGLATAAGALIWRFHRQVPRAVDPTPVSR
jgi:MATE family multidrug resistance protein